MSSPVEHYHPEQPTSVRDSNERVLDESRDLNEGDIAVIGSLIAFILTMAATKSVEVAIVAVCIALILMYAGSRFSENR